MIQITDNTFILETAGTGFQLKKDKTGRMRQLWFGEKTGQPMDFLCAYPDLGFSGQPNEMGQDRTYSCDTFLQALPAWGTGDYRIPGLKADRQIDLKYKSHKVYEGRESIPGLPHGKGADQTLELVLEDKNAGIEAILFYVLFEDSDVIAVHTKIRNTGAHNIVLEKCASAVLELPSGTYDLIHLHGRHNQERMMERVPVHHGITTISSSRGTSSHQHNPGIVITEPDTTEEAGNCWGILLAWSGSFGIEVEKDQLDQVRVVAGILEHQFSWELEPEETFVTPECYLTQSATGLATLSHHYHQFLSDHVMDEKPAPVLINNWEATYFDFDGKKLVDIAKSAADLGLDLFVLDDGWFSTRNSDLSGLGDWEVNEGKLGMSLAELADQVRKTGLSFGIWIEPESVNPDSDLFRNHPDWVLQCSSTPILSRGQLNLDLSNPDVVDHLFSVFDHLLSSAPISYVKWDMNRSLFDWNGDGKQPTRYVLGMYDLLDRLKAAHPDVLFEGCSGGGGRFDAGMLYYTPQIWTSDNTDPHVRARIQEGTSLFYPVHAMGAHASASPNHQTGRETSLAARMATAMHGTFGFELDPDTLTQPEREEIRKAVNFYKSHGDLLRKGRYYRLSLPSGWAWMVTDGRKGLVGGLSFEPAFLRRLKLKGLDPHATYIVDGIAFTGAALMAGGLPIAYLPGTDVPFLYVVERKDS